MVVFPCIMEIRRGKSGLSRFFLHITKTNTKGVKL